MYKKQNKDISQKYPKNKIETKKVVSKDNKVDTANKETLIWGKNSVLDAINSNLNISKIYINENFKKIKIKQNIPVEYVSKAILDQMSNNANHQGYIVAIKSINYSNIEQLIKAKPNIVLALDHIVDPQNLGAIIRTANAAGVKHILLPKDNSAEVNSTALKVASGGFVGINFYKVSSMSATLTKLKNNDYWIYATTLHDNSVNYASVSYPMHTVIVMGNEGSGVSKSVLAVSDQYIHINQYGTVQSLNVSVATGIVLFGYLNNFKK
ncbi:23S rRNA (guanosine(2251)-2'-O)-methyltransferase RlmB [Mycoplasmopsis verecunda]|uniref:23S rRNA (Guanosine2251-2'-O)-methyltransferase n=1 Tax=Mycoplasmopsis verecunda TaxID=171291 RepID=A0A1T4LJQ6_9BACT|nr:23S rRNA (guanosine(2251)-2'-O)-methyltransferase RlmB [Mycoplasmopsis verecunda]WPB54419.1 23S rRNA (guanosine(2251)-2'-O)-methyltransferase RlmB [Mycoplasmopsis verecunda]SJZ54778.1 23S rRNA (guanosine2251-2'-O)-methyltransferase [Mycoplasmopsis verecunda]